MQKTKLCNHGLIKCCCLRDFPGRKMNIPLTQMETILLVNAGVRVNYISPAFACFRHTHFAIKNNWRNWYTNTSVHTSSEKLRGHFWIHTVCIFDSYWLWMKIPSPITRCPKSNTLFTQIRNSNIHLPFSLFFEGFNLCS